MHSIRKMVPTALQMKTRQIDRRFPLGMLFVLMVAGVFWAWVPTAGAEECGFESNSIRVYVKWEGPYRAFIWDAEGLKKIKNPSRPDDPRSRTNVARPFGDRPSFGLPQNLLPQDTRLYVPFAVSRDGRMLVSAVHHGGGDTLPLSQEFAVIDLSAKRLVHLVKMDYYIESVLERHCQDVGRDPATITRTIGSPVLPVASEAERRPPSNASRPSDARR